MTEKINKEKNSTKAPTGKAGTKASAQKKKEEIGFAPMPLAQKLTIAAGVVLFVVMIVYCCFFRFI